MLTWDEKVTPLSPISTDRVLPEATLSDLSTLIVSSPLKDLPTQPVAHQVPSSRRVSATEKCIINGETDVNQLAPFKCKRAWRKYLPRCTNHWMPQAINMACDIANRRVSQIGLEQLFQTEENRFPWMIEVIDLKKKRNFFETHVIEYQSGGAQAWD